MAQSMLQKFDSILDKATKVLTAVSGVMTLLMVFVTVYGVGMRYFFRRPEPISYELATIFMLWSFLFAMSFVELRGEHIRADIFIPLMPDWLVKALHGIISNVLAIIYCSILTWKGWEVAYYSLSIGERSMSIWAEPLGPIKLMIPIGYFVMTLVCVRNLCHGIAAYSPNHKTADQT